MIRKILQTKHCSLFGVISFFFFSLSLLIGYPEESSNHLLILVKACLVVLSAITYLLACNESSEEKYKSRFALLSLVILIYEILLMAVAGKTILYIRDYPAIINSIIWTSSALFSVLRFGRDLTFSFLNVIRSKDTLILISSSAILASVVIIMSLEPSGIMFSWDSDTLYDFIYHLDYESLYDAKLLTFHSHVSIVYAHILVLFKLLLNSVRSSFFVVNSLCIICSSFGMTFLLRNLLPNNKTVDHILGNALYMLSPWILGLSTYHIYDFYIWCLFPLLIYFLSEENWIGYNIIGILITFSKASGLIVFGSVCIVVLAHDIIFQIKARESLASICKRIVFNVKYLSFASVLLVFLIMFKLGIDASIQFEDTYFGINPRHIFWLLKIYETSNFLWIFVILSLICIYTISANRRAKNDYIRKIVYILVVSDIIFVLFNCLCITYRLPRYMDSHIAVVFILGSLFLLGISNSKIKYLLITLIIVINSIASFISIDPVSKLLFNMVNVGDHTITDYEMGDAPTFGDSIVCNREYYSYEVLFDKVLTHIMNSISDQDEILFSLGNQQNTWGMSCGRYSYTFNDQKHDFQLFYDKTIKGLANGYDYEYYDSEYMIPFEIHYVFPEETVPDAISTGNADVFYYIYMPTINEDRENEISAKYNVISNDEFSFRGWKMNCIKFTIEVQ